MHITTPLADELASYLDLSALELKVTAQNMANVDTPGYRTMGFNFAAAIQQSVESMEERRLHQQRAIETAHGLNGDGLGGAFAAMDTASDTAPMPPEPDPVALRQVGGLLERPDGNDVSVDREGLKMAEAQLQFRMGLELLKQEYTRVTDAIQVDK